MNYRHKPWRASFVAATLLTFAVGAGTAHATETLVIAGWGGYYEPGLREVGFLPEFEKKFDVKVSWLSMSSYQNYGRIKAQRDNPQVDIALIDDIVQEQAAREGLFAPLDPSIVKYLDDIEDRARMPDDVGVGFGYNITAVYYNEKVFAEKGFAPPTTWADFYRPELKGRIILRHITSGYGLYPMLMLARLKGGSEHDIEPGFEAMKELAPSVITFPTSGGKTRQFMLQGDAWMSVTGMGEFQTLIEKGAPLKFVIPEEGTIAIIETVNVVKGAPHPRLAQEFVNALISPEGQYKMALALKWRPTSMKVPVDDTIKAALPVDPTGSLNLVSIDFQQIMKDRETWTERFNKEVAVIAGQ